MYPVLVLTIVVSRPRNNANLAGKSWDFFTWKTQGNGFIMLVGGLGADRNYFKGFRESKSQ